MTNPTSSKNSKFKLMTEKEGARCSRLALTKRVMHLESALEQIASWDFPYESYQWHWGFDGVKEYFQSIAKHGLDSKCQIYIYPEPDIIENLKVFGFNKKVAESKG